MTKLCPTCGQKLPDPRGPKRICVRCKRPIRRHDRWHFTPTGPQHNDCLEPEGEVEERPQRMLSVVKEAQSA